MGNPFECSECGNPRPLAGICPSCNSDAIPYLHEDTAIFNLKQDGPTVDEAVDRLTHYLRRASEVGIKAIILIHGYGSSGEGGRIKATVHRALENNYFSDRVDEYHFGEHVPFGSDAYHQLLRRRPSLKSHLKHFKTGNAGMTVLLLGNDSRIA
jgi:Smr domain